MSFNARDLRRWMDVFSSDGVYLGTVVWIIHQPATPGPHSPAWERGSSAGVSSSLSGASFSGESLGPMPTAALGNGGPGRQSAATNHASAPAPGTGRHARRPAELVVLRMLTSLNWSTFRPSVRRIPVSMVQAASLERIVLSATDAELDDGR
jgi:hypothetical protein